MPSLGKEYIYRPLRPGRNELRLVRLFPARSGREVEIEIFHAEPASKPQYEALSYVWGASHRTHEVCIRPSRIEHRTFEREFARLSYQDSRKTLGISKNLSIALSHLTLPHKPRILWIDAICINQDDPTERAKEVGKMGTIYSQAQRVVVWLGEGGPDTDLAFETLKALGEGVTVSHDDLGPHFDLLPGGEPKYLESHPRSARARVRDWIAIRTLLTSPWFGRLWVFQEIGRSSDAIMVMGTYSISWTLFQAAFSWLREQENNFPSPTLISVLNKKVLSVIQPIMDYSLMRNERWRMDDQSFALTSLLVLTKQLECFDPRDRIYSILSMMDPNEASRTFPSYTKPVPKVYTEATLATIQCTNKLDILSICDFEVQAKSNFKLPSWVPDISTPNPLHKLLRGIASGLSANESIYYPEDGVLRLQSKHQCKIKYVAFAVPLEASLVEILAICHSWEPPQASKRRYMTGESLLDAFVSLLVEGCTTNRSCLVEQPELFTRKAMREAYQTLVADGVVTEDLRIYAKWLEVNLPGRSFFTSEEGFIGLCPASAQPGDVVHVALGCYNPILLRPVTNKRHHYAVGGECYVAGIMDGEGILGPLPLEWTWRREFLRGQVVLTFVSRRGIPTQYDPRAGRLPRRWTVFYGDVGSIEKHDNEVGPDGKLREQWFENLDTGLITACDPRFTAENLRKFGTNVHDIYLV